MLRVLVLVCSLVGLAYPAAADVRVDYRHLEDGSTIKAEAADNGDARLQFSNQPFYLIIRGGEAYVVYTITPEPRVVRVSDLQKVYEQSPPAIHFESKTVDSATWLKGETATYAGHSGEAYFLQFPEGRSPRPALVVSRDPRLRGIGIPFSRQMDFSIASMQLAGQTVPPNFRKLREFVGTGTPLLFAGYKAEKVTIAPVDAKEFELPAQPVPIEELRANAAAASPAQ